MGAKIIVNIAGGVALLLWGLHMVNTGIVRAFGTRLRRWLGKVLKNTIQAFTAGIGVTAILQSSTATALMLSSFSASGVVALAPALAVMLGANVGTTLIVQVLSFDASALSPLLIITGYAVFKRSKQTLFKDLGRVAIGLGLMLLSLGLLVDSLTPVQNSATAQQLFNAMADEPVLTLFVAAILTWAAHSSVATVLLTMSLAASGLVTPLASMALVLGANLGSAFNPLLEGLSSANPANKRMPLGNLFNRILGCLIFLPLLPFIAEPLAAFDSNPARLTANFHVLFNLVMALIFLLPLGLVAKLLELLLPEKKITNDPATPIYLDKQALSNPVIALSCATRETLRMGDLIEQMLQNTITAIMTNDRKLVAQISQMDDSVDRLHETIKLYVVKITQNSLEDHENRRAMEIHSLSINLEHIGDIIDKNLMELASKKIKHQLQFSDEGAQEIVEFHSIVVNNLKLAMTVFLSGDVKSARMLLAQKSHMRELELKAAKNHMKRLREERLASLETSSLHLDIIRDLKRIHSHICSTAYPALEAADELNKSRLKAQQP